MPFLLMLSDHYHLQMMMYVEIKSILFNIYTIYLYNNWKTEINNLARNIQ